MTKNAKITKPGLTLDEKPFALSCVLETLAVLLVAAKKLKTWAAAGIDKVKPKAHRQPLLPGMEVAQ